LAETEIIVVRDASALTKDAARRIIAAAEAKLAANNCFFSLVLSGGSTPKALYELLASDPYKSQLNWSKVDVFFGDERCVPPDDKESNYLMAHVAMLSKLPLPEPNIHRMRGELPPEQAAIEYGKQLKERFHDDGPDFVLLGMGDDGHTASLFPGTAALDETEHRCVANYVPRMDTWRVTMTYPFLNKAVQVLIMVAGQSKAARIKQVLDGPRDPHTLPIQGIAPAGKLTWLLDEGAASMREKNPA
jgi:6-phosphogluconolactonase